MCMQLNCVESCSLYDPFITGPVCSLYVRPMETCMLGCDEIYSSFVDLLVKTRSNKEGR